MVGLFALPAWRARRKGGERLTGYLNTNGR
jgi:hypothetical protein